MTVLVSGAGCKYACGLGASQQFERMKCGRKGKSGTGTAILCLEIIVAVLQTAALAKVYNQLSNLRSNLARHRSDRTLTLFGSEAGNVAALIIAEAGSSLAACSGY